MNPSIRSEMFLGIALPSIWAASLVTARAALLGHETTAHHGTWMSAFHPIVGFGVLALLGLAAFVHGWIRLNRVISN